MPFRVIGTELVFPIGTTRRLDNMYERVNLYTEQLAMQDWDVKKESKTNWMSPTVHQLFLHGGTSHIVPSKGESRQSYKIREDRD